MDHSERPIMLHCIVRQEKLKFIQGVKHHFLMYLRLPEAKAAYNAAAGLLNYYYMRASYYYYVIITTSYSYVSYVRVYLHK
jgi:hypothetical protein